MGALFSYMLRVSVIMTLLYLGYKWLMAGSTFHAFNRFTLLGILAASWLIPLCMPLFRVTHAVDVEMAGMPVVSSLPPTGAVVEAQPGVAVAQILLAAYVAGALAALVITLKGAWRVYRLICGGDISRREDYVLVINSHAPGPMSWGRYIIIRPQDCDADMEMVLGHERAHLKSRHWLDLLLTQMNLIFQWYNPSAWLLMREVKCVHEYQADARVACDDAAAYQLMLLKKTVGSSFPTFTDSLNHSQIKKRITMMLRKKSVSARRMAVLALPAMAALGVFTLSIPAIAGSLAEIQHAAMPDFSPRKITNSFSPVQADDVTLQMRGDAVPPSASASGRAEGAVTDDEVTEQQEKPTTVLTIRGEELVSEDVAMSPAYFVDGKLFTGRINDLEPGDIKSVTVVKNDPAYPQGKIMIELKKPGDAEATVPEKIAEFKGGMSALMDFVSQNIKMPDVEIKEKERVIVQFTIGADGSVSKPVVVRGAKFAELDKEAVRIVCATDGMWIPAETNGKPVATRFVLPVTFTPAPSKQ